MQQPSLSCLHAGSFGVEDLHKFGMLYRRCMLLLCNTQVATWRKAVLRPKAYRPRGAGFPTAQEKL